MLKKRSVIEIYQLVHNDCKHLHYTLVDNYKQQSDLLLGTDHSVHKFQGKDQYIFDWGKIS